MEVVNVKCPVCNEEHEIECEMGWEDGALMVMDQSITECCVCGAEINLFASFEIHVEEPQLPMVCPDCGDPVSMQVDWVHEHDVMIDGTLSTTERFAKIGEAIWRCTEGCVQDGKEAIIENEKVKRPC